jgi:hypothetical protein
MIGCFRKEKQILPNERDSISPTIRLPINESDQKYEINILETSKKTEYLFLQEICTKLKNFDSFTENEIERMKILDKENLLNIIKLQNNSIAKIISFLV